VSCDTQAEIDRYWTHLTAGGKEVQCGWLVDKFGVSWQIVPGVLFDMISDKDSARAGRAMKAMLGMKKLDIAALQRAYDGR
jgi:predicted 3-demethylubiquinone-9 3-methyltransferase (glyoxalase superfamily)